jgi:hypothetical protein
MATLLNTLVGNVFMGRTCATTNPDRTVRLGTGNTGTGDRKTAVGTLAAMANAGSDNTAFGYYALKNNTSSCNTAIGSYSLFNTTTGNSNVGIGFKALCNNTTGSGNVGIGSCTYGGGSQNNNVLIGYRAGLSGGLCSGNVLVGTYTYSTGYRNVVIGCNALHNGGNGGVAIGCYAISKGTCSIAIGNGAYAGPTNIMWGGPANSSCNCVWGTWSYISDCRDKSDIVELNDNLGINLIRKLKPKTYRNDNRKSYVLKCNYEFGVKDGTLKVDRRNYGFIAQEVKDAADELNVDFFAVKYNQNQDIYKLSYSQLIASIVKTIKTIDDRIQILKTKV